MFYKEVSDLMTTSNDQGIMTALSQGSSFNELTMSVVKQIEWDYMPHQYDIDNHLSDQDLIISGITETYNNATVVVADLNNQVTQFQNDLVTTVQSKADQIEALYKETSITRLSIEARLDAIAAKLAKIENLVDKFEQPVKFFGNDSISHAAEEPTNNTVYNDLELDFQTSNGTSGLLFHTREEASNSSLSLYMQGGSLIFEFNIDGAVETVRSMVDVCDGCWFRVHANRYGNTGQLTVTRLSTGGTTSSFSSTPLDINIYLALPGPFYVGGLPNGVDPHMNRGYFEGCVYNVIFDGVQVPIWKARTLAGETACCSKPVETDTSTSTSGVTMNGFGYVELKQNDLNFAETSGVSVHFRTYDTDAVILAVDAEKTDEYYGIFLKQGQLVFEYGSDASNIYVKTSNTYNDGGWHQVVTYHNSTEAMISVLSLNDTGYHLQETVKSILVTSTAPMTSLAFANVYLGGVAPDFKASWLPVDPSFAGCLKELQHSKGSDPLLYIRNITDSLIQQEGVDLKGCIDEIIPGLSFASDTAYAWIGLLPATTVTFNTIQFQLYTEQHDGILVYVQSATDPTMHLYVSVYGGIVFMKIGDAAPILTTDMFVSNGQQQDITIDISTSSPKLIVNGQTFTSPGTVSTGLVASSFYVGGVPNSVVLDHDLPVQASLQGGIDQLYINNNLLDFFRVSIILAQSGASLAGLPLPPDTLPLPPFTTTTSIPTSPAPSCAVTPSYGSVTEGVRFGDQDVSYLAFNLGSTSNLFTTSFVLVTEFRALDPNGLIYYAASSENDPSSWLALYLQDGYLTFSMQTDTKDFRTKGVQLSKKYDDGNWWESTVLRINDFVALIVTSRSDYKNNEVPSTQFSNLNVNTDLFIGGVTPNITGYPFNGTIPVGKLPFSGCLRKMELNSHTQPNPIIFDLSAPSYSQGTGQCYANVVPGVYFAGSGYAHISNNFTVGNSLEVDFTLKPTENTGILMTLVTSTDHYAVLQLNDGQVELLLPNASNTSSPVILSTFLLLKPHDICDGSEHTLSAHVNTSHVVIRVDGVRHVAAVPPESTAWVMTLDGGNLYLAGKPGGVTNHSAGMVTNNFSGCVTSMAVNGDVKNPREVAELTGAMIGCPSG
ncbi:laminin subunit alpha-2-like [Lineus longissimus]|uniref:laminin subunit alpha-2-like n=1 Tax=Lineus longissimus TaxID=88925 RepID=UPI00315CD54E